MSEQIVLVDKRGQRTGVAEKLSSHHSNTPMHLAFSCYVFNQKGELLVTKRAASKKVWPGVWTNTVCGHPAPDEPMEVAIRRRLKFELGMEAHDFKVVLPTYRYETPPFNGIIEREFCPVYVARSESNPSPNPTEVESWKWLPWRDFTTAALEDREDKYSWWSKDQVKLLTTNLEIKRLAKI